jgi:Fe2+ or Zn2+ uptake regulation protein
MPDMEHIGRILRDNGYKVTNQRKAIIEVLLENRDHFLSAQDIYIKSREKYPDTNFSTVYRNLDILESTGILHNTKINGDVCMYEIVCSDTHHHHIICTRCGKTETIDFCPFEEINRRLEGDSFTLTGHKFELYGYCRDCRDGKNKCSK